MITNPIDWSKADWQKQDIELAKQYGCSREAARQARNRCHGGKALQPHKWLVQGARDRLALIDTAGLELPELASMAGVSERRVADLLKGLGKTFKRRPKGNALYDWSKMPSDWANRTDKELAELVGVPNPDVVTIWRYRHGMKKVSENIS